MKTISYEEGIRLLEVGNHREAQDIFIALIREDDKNHKAENALGVSLMRTEYYVLAQSHFETALKLSPGNVEYLKNYEENQSKNPLKYEYSGWFLFIYNYIAPIMGFVLCLICIGIVLYVKNIY
ncbi:hypothetical protein [Methanospirillum purgamenti]|uniref:tetratricopeptide repeat protein n=1 Tax=Methanospirillum purgamenti TaxID=2834276 RepID=UPI002A23FBB6|nr:hypothetical protein [Methanospirillum hungatei]MDX8551898.1 hypothetical protein [Methanospirillum hungatei]